MCWACLHAGRVGRAGDAPQPSQAAFCIALPLICTFLCSVCAAGMALHSKAQSTRHSSAAAKEGTQHWGSSERESYCEQVLPKFNLSSSTEIRKRERWQGQQGQAGSGSNKVLTDAMCSKSIALKWGAISDVHFGGNQDNSTHQRNNILKAFPNQIKRDKTQTLIIFRRTFVTFKYINHHGCARKWVSLATLFWSVPNWEYLL